MSDRDWTLPPEGSPGEPDEHAETPPPTAAPDEPRRLLPDAPTDAPSHTIAETVSEPPELGLEPPSGAYMTDADDRSLRRDDVVHKTRYGAAILGAACAALVGGAVWGLVVRIADRELRLAPVLVGLLVGLATRYAGGGKGRDSGGLHAISALFTLAGIVLGKYLTFAYLFVATVPVEPTVQPSPINSGVLSADTFRLFVENPGVSFSALDGLWVMLAVGVAMLALVPSDEAEGSPRHRSASHNPVDKVTRGLPEPLRVAADWVVTIVGAVVIVLLVKQFAVNPYRIPSSSMEPTLHCAQPESGCEARFSDRVLANRFVYHLRDPRRGDIVVFNVPAKALQKCGANGVFVKRLIGLPGETIELRLRHGDGYVFINGKELKEPYIQKSRRAAVESFAATKIPPGNYFMMGDNRSQSCDSRLWGTVPRSNIIGKVFATYWPPTRIRLH